MILVLLPILLGKTVNPIIEESIAALEKCGRSDLAQQLRAYHDELLTPEQAAAEIGISSRQFLRYNLPACRIARTAEGKRQGRALVRYRRQTILDFIAASEPKS